MSLLPNQNSFSLPIWLRKVIDMFFRRKSKEQFEQEIMKDCSEQIKLILADSNKKLSEAIEAVIKYQDATDTNTLCISSLSESISALTKMFQTLSGRLTNIETQLSFSNLKLGEKKN